MAGSPIASENPSTFIYELVSGCFFHFIGRLAYLCHQGEDATDRGHYAEDGEQEGRDLGRAQDRTLLEFQIAQRRDCEGQRDGSDQTLKKYM